MQTEKSMRAIYITLVAIIGLLIIFPILFLVFGSFWSASPIAKEGHLTLENWTRALTMDIPATLPVLFFNSLVFAVSTAVLSVILGITMAYLVARTNMPYGRTFENLSIIPRAFPIIIAALAWIMLLSPRIGVLNLVSKEYFGFPVFNLYSFPGMIFLMVLYESPIVFLMAVNAFRLMDPSLEEQSIVCGNTLMGTLIRVTLPTLRPLILSAFILIFIVGIITLEIPIIIGSRSGIFVFTTAIYEIINSEYESLSLYNAASALAMFIIPISLITLFLYRHSVKNVEKFVTVTGKARPHSLYNLGKLRYLAFIVFSFYFFLAIILPALVVVLLSFSEFFQSPSMDSLTNLTLKHWVSAFDDVVFWRAIKNTLILSSAGATLCVIVALSLGYILVRSGAKLKGPLEACAMLPLAFPGTILAIGFVWAYIKTPMYGTIWIILIYFVGNYLPFALRTLSPFLFQFHHEFEEASWVSGAGRVKTVIRIVVPLLKGGIISVWVLLFQIYFKEFAGAIILFTYGTEVLSTLLFLRAFDEGLLGMGAVLGVIMLVASLGLHVLVGKKSSI
jgi:iron(III) transport system permease protein